MLSNFWQDSRLMTLVAGLLTLCAGMLFVISVGSWISRQPYFQIRYLALTGEVDRVNQIAFETSVLPKIDGGFFDADLPGIKQIIEAQPWVRRVSVQRKWPNALLVEVETHTPLARWGDAQLLNTFGEAFTANVAEAEEGASLPLLNGPEGSELLVARMYLKLLTELRGVGLETEVVSLSERYAWTVNTDSGLQIEFGRDASDLNIEKKLLRFKRIYPRLIDGVMASLTQVDMRYPQGLAVKGERVKPEAAPKAS